MKNFNKTHFPLRTSIQRVLLIIVMMLTMQPNFLNAQCSVPKGAQSSVFGNPYQEAYFSNPIIQGATTVCSGQTTTLSVDSGYSSYYWSNGNTTPATTVGAGSYTITVSDVLGCTRSNSIVVISNPCGLTLNLKCYMQGYYTGAGSMAPVLMNEGVGSNSTVTDTIEIELRNENTPYFLVASSKAILNTNGTATAIYTAASAGSYYIAVKHRNGLYTWSATPVIFGASPVNYDFSLANIQAYGNNQIEVESGVWALYQGDFNFDDNIDLLDASTLENDINIFAFGYFATDLNGDGNVDLLDSSILEININSFIFSNHP